MATLEQLSTPIETDVTSDLGIGLEIEGPDPGTLNFEEIDPIIDNDINNSYNQNNANSDEIPKQDEYQEPEIHFEPDSDTYETPNLSDAQLASFIGETLNFLTPQITKFVILKTKNVEIDEKELKLSASELNSYKKQITPFCTWVLQKVEVHPAYTFLLSTILVFVFPALIKYASVQKNENNTITPDTDLRPKKKRGRPKKNIENQ